MKIVIIKKCLFNFQKKQICQIVENYENSKTAPTMHTFYEMLNRISVNNAFDKRDKQHRMCAFYSKTIAKCQKLNSV